MSQRNIWVCETGEYEQRGVWGVYASPEIGFASVKATHGPPYKVRWDEPRHYESEGYESWTLTGHFEWVPGYSAEHTAHYEFIRHELIEGDDERS